MESGDHSGDGDWDRVLMGNVGRSDDGDCYDHWRRRDHD